MMPDVSPWGDISTPNSDLNVRQVAGNTAVPCYWGRDVQGACLFILELTGDHTTQFRKNVTNIYGIEVDLRDSGTGTQRLILTLEKQVDRDLFEGLCRTLVASLAHASDSSSSLAVTLAHIRRWKTFFSGRANHMSLEAIRGLAAELFFLLELLDRFASAADAVAAWLGPEKSHQDFIFGNSAVEIKSLSGTERSSVQISSEDQLESLNDALFLRIYRLSNLPDTPKAQSLNDIILEVQSKLADGDVIEEFDRKLVAQGYAPLPEYDEPRFVVSEVRTFRVGEGFSRLKRSALPEGIEKVTYQIRLEAIASSLCDNEMVFGED